MLGLFYFIVVLRFGWFSTMLVFVCLFVVVWLCIYLVTYLTVVFRFRDCCLSVFWLFVVYWLLLLALIGFRLFDFAFNSVGFLSFVY